MANGRWYAKIDGLVVGPISSSEIKNLVQKGGEVRFGEDGNWIPAVAIEEVMTSTPITPSVVGKEEPKPQAQIRKNIPQKKKSQNPIKDAVFGGLLVIFIGMVVVGAIGQAVVDSKNSVGDDKKPRRHWGTPKTGEEGVLESEAGIVLYGRSQRSVDRYQRLELSNDEFGMKEMLLDGEILVATNETKCRVIKTGIFTFEVRIMSEPQFGDLAFVSREFVKYP